MKKIGMERKGQRGMGRGGSVRGGRERKQERGYKEGRGGSTCVQGPRVPTYATGETKYAYFLEVKVR